MSGNLTDEMIQILRDTYLEQGNVSLTDLSKMSRDLCGVQVSPGAIRHLSRRGKWGVIKRRRSLGKDGVPDSVEDEADDLRAMVYERITDPDSNLSAGEFSQLIGSWDKLRAVAPQRRSGKTSRQLRIEATRRAAKKIARMKHANNDN